MSLDYICDWHQLDAGSIDVKEFMSLTCNNARNQEPAQPALFTYRKYSHVSQPDTDFDDGVEKQ